MKIRGKIKLKGKIEIQGNKNSALPILVATCLTSEPCYIYNLPNITDVSIMIDTLKRLGKKIKGNKIEGKIKDTYIDDLTIKTRASILLSSILNRKINTGGCELGKRENNIIFSNNIYLPEASVTMTENALLYAAKSKFKLTTIKNVAHEPHVYELIEVLSKMGATIQFSDSCRIFSDKLKGFEYIIGNDHIEAGTYKILNDVTSSKLKFKSKNLEPLDYILHNKPDKIVTNIWPGFPTDLMSQIIVWCTQQDKSILCHDWMYENRMDFITELHKMGAHIVKLDQHRIMVYPSKLKGTKVRATNIRAGAALIIAALCAEGETEIENEEVIARGYDLNKLKTFLN